MDYLAGIDLGSTSLKCVIYDLAGDVVASGTRPTERYNPHPDHPEWTVWQPQQIWGGTAAAVKEAVAKLNNPRNIKAVAVTGMGMDGVPVDEQGNWLYPFISWHDPRTEAQLRWWEDHIGADKTFGIGGNTLWRFSTALRLLWMAEHEPEILARTDKWLLIEDFLNFMLCGRRATDYTMASCTLLFDQRQQDWSEDVLTQAGIERRLLCEVYPSGTLLGEVTTKAAEATGLAVGTPVVLGGHDYLCGALPVGAFAPGVVLDVTGTWEIVLAAIPAPVLTPKVQKLGVTVETHVARDTYAVWGGAVASDMLEWYRKEYGFEAQQRAASQKEGGVDWDYLMAEASASPAGARGVMFLPHMSAAGCPVVDARSLGAFVGLSNFVQRGDMLRAIVEGLDYQVLDIVTAFKTGLGIQSGSARSSGRRHAQCVLDAEQGRCCRPADRCARHRRGHDSRCGYFGRYWRSAYTATSRMLLSASTSQAKPTSQTHNSHLSMPSGIKSTDSCIRFSSRSAISFTISLESEQKRPRHE